MEGEAVWLSSAEFVLVKPMVSAPVIDHHDRIAAHRRRVATAAAKVIGVRIVVLVVVQRVRCGHLRHKPHARLALHVVAAVNPRVIAHFMFPFVVN